MRSSVWYKITCLALWVALVISFSACTRDYQKELQQLLTEFKASGKDILLESDSFFIYVDSSAFWYRDLDHPAKKILSSDQQYEVISYGLVFDESGQPQIKKYTSSDKLSPLFFNKTKKEKMQDGDVYPYDRNKMSICSNKGIRFTYTEHIYNRYDEEEDIDWNYVCYFSNSTSLILIDPEAIELHSELVLSVSTYARSLADAVFGSFSDEYNFPFSYSAVEAEGGQFKTTFSINEHGDVSGMGFIEYSHEFYPDLNARIYPEAFASKSSVKTLLQGIENAVVSRQQALIKERRLAEAQAYIDNSITLKQLSKEYRNTVKFNQVYKHQYIYLRCRLEFFKPANGFFDPNNYKYKVTSSSVNILGQWLSDYDLTGYTNDQRFMNLTYPQEVIMKARIVSASSKVFEFDDCELIYVFD